MTIITNLTGSSAPGFVPELRGVITAVHDEPVKGFFRCIKLTGNALLISKGNDVVAIPLDALTALAAAHAPALQPPQQVTNPAP